MSNHPDTPSVSPDRPVVDGRSRSSEDLRRDLEQQSDPGQEDALANVEEVREELGATVAELAARFDVPTRVRDSAARARDTAVAAARTHLVPIAVAAGVALIAVAARRVRRVRRA